MFNFIDVEGKDINIIDFNVYHKNQNFRLVASSKLGSNRFLKRDKDFTDDDFNNLNIYDFLKETIVTNFENNYIIFNTTNIRKELKTLFTPNNVDNQNKKKLCTIQKYNNASIINMNQEEHEEKFISMINSINNISDTTKKTLIEAFKIIFQYFLESKCICKITCLKQYNDIFVIGTSCTYCKIERF